MFYFALANLALGSIYAFLDPEAVPPYKLIVLCGIALAFLFSNADKIMRSKFWPLLIIGTVIVEALLHYAFMQNVASAPHSHILSAFMSTVTLATVIVAIIALRFFWAKREEDLFYVELLAFFATCANLLFLTR